MFKVSSFYGCADLDAMNCACTGKLRHGAIVQYKENQFVAAQCFALIEMRCIN